MIPQLLQNSWKIFVLLLKAYFNNGNKKSPNVSLTGIGKFTFEVVNEKNTKTEDFKNHLAYLTFSDFFWDNPGYDTQEYIDLFLCHDSKEECIDC